MSPRSVAVLFTNSPGELSAWVYPVCVLLHRDCPDVDIVVMLTPCQYASGQESKVASAFPGVVGVIEPSQTLKVVLGLTAFPFDYDNGVVCYLGGDPMYSKRFAKRMGFPVMGYTEHSALSGKGFDFWMLRSRTLDLMGAKIALSPPFDRTQVLKKYGLEDKPYTLFLLGSRPLHFEAMFELMAPVLTQMCEADSSFAPLLLISPFVSDALLQKVTSGNTFPFKFCRGESSELMQVSQFIVTIPGTNMAEAMYLHRPMGMLLPLNKPKVFIFDGLLGILAKLPILGQLVSKGIVTYLKTQHRMYALPNKLANERVVPEAIDIFSPSTLLRLLHSWVKDRELHYRQETLLKSLFIPSENAANEIVLWIRKKLK